MIKRLRPAAIDRVESLQGDSVSDVIIKFEGLREESKRLREYARLVRAEAETARAEAKEERASSQRRQLRIRAIFANR